ncbi:MAG TPA: N-acetylmuramoyl-L-alanine amidase [Blastocatellia bacterium]|nr:N-acetylmuramoyl-L-alanine amidase [Blastocatellia bacterium]
MVRLHRRSCVKSASVLAAFSLFLNLIAVPKVTGQRQAETRLNTAFQNAAKEFEVPRELLVAIAYAETHFDGHNGEPSADNGYGLMHLVDNPYAQTLEAAAKLIGVPVEGLKTDMAENIRGGAALLRFYADEQGLNEKNRGNLAAWYEVVARYSNASDMAVARLYADEVYKLLKSGFSGASPQGEEIIVFAIEVEPQRGIYERVSPLSSPDYAPTALDYGPALWAPANAGNYAVSNRVSSSPINYVVIHTTQGSYAGTISWFQNPSSNVSSHYVIRSSDGQITQMVREKDIAWHAGNSTYNAQSIGIEHEGFVDNPSWYTDSMYRASAALTRNVCLKYGIPMTRSRIIAHSEVPGATHTDPGPNWNWTFYMQLVTQSSSWETIIDNETSGRFTASANWGFSSFSSQRRGSDYRFTTPQPISDAAWFMADIPATGNYEVFAWYPANSGYNSSTPFVIVTTSGNQVVHVNQQINGGRWVSLGTFNLSGGDHDVVGVSRWTSTSGYVIADAVRIVRR